MQNIVKYLQEVREVFKTITWPKRDTLIQLTVVVISISIVISLVLGGFDYVFTNSIGFLGELKNQVPAAKTSIAVPSIVITSPSPTLPAKTTVTPKKSVK